MASVVCWRCWLLLQVQHIASTGGRATAVTSCTTANSQQQQHQHTQQSPQQPQQQQQQEEEQQEFPADAVVIAAGVAAPDLCDQLGYRLPLLHKPAAIVMTGPLQPGLLRHMVVTDTIFILQVR